MREIKLFGGAGYDHANDDAHGWTSPPLAGPPLLMLNALDPALGRCAAFTEPGAVWTKRALYLALACEEFHFIPPGVRPKIVLLSCTQPCRPSTPASWRYAGTPLTSDDANSFGFDGFTAADLYVDHDRAFLLVSPSSDHPVRGAYNGCIVFQLADIAAGSLARKDGRPILMERVSGTKGSFNGACTYQPTVSAAGVLYGEIDLSSRRPYFRIFSKNRLEITSH